MSDKNNKPKIIFAPGSLDNFDGTPEELAAMIAEITEMVESGDFFTSPNFINATDLDEEAQQNLIEMLGILTDEPEDSVKTWSMKNGH